MKIAAVVKKKKDKEENTSVFGKFILHHYVSRESYMICVKTQ